MSLEDALNRFWSRDYRADIAFLDAALARNGAVGAGLADTPPSILTGDPFALEQENCLLVLGINPAWPSEDRAAKIRAVDIGPAEVAWKAGFGAYRDHRGTYFSDGDARYNGRHFTRLGNAISQGFCGTDGKKAKKDALRIFRHHAAIFDLLPYWSRGTTDLDLGKVDLAAQDCLREWHDVIGCFIAEMKPRAILINTSGQKELVESLLDCEFEWMPASRVYLGRQTSGVPIFLHKQLNATGGLSHEQYKEAARLWARKVGVNLPLIHLT